MRMMLDCTATSPQNTPKYVINMFSHMRAIAALLGARAELTCPCRRLLFRQGHKGALNHRFFSKIFTFLNHRCQATTLFMALLAPNQVGALGMPAISLRSAALPPIDGPPPPQNFHAMHKPPHHRLERELHSQGTTPWRAEAYLVGGQRTLKPKP